MTDEVRSQRDVDPFRKQIGLNVRAEIARIGVGQDRLAEVLGVSQPQISKRLSGSIGFEAAELVRISVELGIPLSLLVSAPAASAA